MRAINNDSTNELRWSRKGGLLMLDIARGLTFLHANRVCFDLLLGTLLLIIPWLWILLAKLHLFLRSFVICDQHQYGTLYITYSSS